jgi:hypothetical protein
MIAMFSIIETSCTRLLKSHSARRHFEAAEPCVCVRRRHLALAAVYTMSNTEVPGIPMRHFYLMGGNSSLSLQIPSIPPR